MNSRKRLDRELDKWRKRLGYDAPLGVPAGRSYWQCLEELAQTDAFQALVTRIQRFTS
jgi:hypothetical protein